MQLVITATGSGRTVVTVAAEDPEGARTSDAFTVIAGLATSTREDEVPSKEFGLDPNYPNPFSENTTIPLKLPEAAEVKLVVYDLLGQAVFTLVEGSLPAGRHEIKFAAAGLTPGVYMLRLEAGSRKASQAIVVSE